MHRLTPLWIVALLATGCTGQDHNVLASSPLCAETAADLTPTQGSTLDELATAQWRSELVWADSEEPVPLTLQLSVVAEDGAAIERALVSEEGWASSNDCAATIEAWAHVRVWTTDGRLDARFSGDVVVQEGVGARFSGSEDGGLRYLAVTFEGQSMSGLLLPPDDEFAEDADADGVGAPAASWPAP